MRDRRRGSVHDLAGDDVKYAKSDDRGDDQDPGSPRHRRAWLHRPATINVGRHHGLRSTVRNAEAPWLPCFG